jgi:hypothetical protein
MFCFHMLAFLQCKYLYADLCLRPCVVSYPSFCETTFCGVLSCAFDKLGCAVGEEWLWNFVLQSQGREFYNSVLLSVGKSVLKMTETLQKNSLIIQRVWIGHVNFIVIAVTFLSKNLWHYFYTAPRIIVLTTSPFTIIGGEVRSPYFLRDLE